MTFTFTFFNDIMLGASENKSVWLFLLDEYSRSARKNLVTDIKHNIIKRKELLKRQDTQ